MLLCLQVEHQVVVALFLDAVMEAHLILQNGIMYIMVFSPHTNVCVLQLPANPRFALKLLEVFGEEKQGYIQLVH